MFLTIRRWQASREPGVTIRCSRRCPGSSPRQGRDHGPVSPVRLRAGDLTAQDRDLVPEHQDFQVRRAGRRGESARAPRVDAQVRCSARVLARHRARPNDFELLTRRARLAGPIRDEPFRRLGLTARETEVLDLLVEGRTNRQIGDVLFISEKTASVHVTNLLRKLGVQSRTEAAEMSRRLR